MWHGEGGIRTREGCYTLLAFQASALGHYATSPLCRIIIRMGWQGGKPAHAVLLKEPARSQVARWVNG